MKSGSDILTASCIGGFRLGICFVAILAGLCQELAHTLALGICVVCMGMAINLGESQACIDVGAASIRMACKMASFLILCPKKKTPYVLFPAKSPLLV